MVDTRKSNKNKADRTKVKKNLNSAVTTGASPKVNKIPTALVSKLNNAKKKKAKRLNYSPQNLQNAIKALDTGISLRKAAKAFGVPLATLARRKNNPEIVKTKTGPANVLSEAEEQEIVNWILHKAERGYPVTKTELLNSVQKYIESLKRKTPFTNNRPGRHWYEGFRKRNPNLLPRTVQHLTLTRATVTREKLREWFNEQDSYLNNKNLLGISPNSIFNCNETNILLCPNSGKVLAEKGCCSDESLTVLFMYSAAGTRAPPLLMFAYTESVPKKMIQNTPKGWGIGISESGRMTAEAFYEYMTNVFYPWLLRENIQFPVIIYLDNHSHMTIPLVSFCRNKQIEIIPLYHNSTHMMHPLDTTFVHLFKETWEKTVAKWKIQKNVMQLKKEDFPTVLKMALDNLKEEKDVIQSGFKASGLVPFNPNAVIYDVLPKKEKSESISTHNEETMKVYRVSDTITEDAKQHLQNFEKNIPPELLLEFKNALSNGSWTGNIEKKALFEYWLQILGKHLLV
ncbi:uncharacterized protein LOC143369932 [Andrena cerasifolii]|uniref:uncharacterized protein LOC143369932 n=1 Tax=Andrena cerasifolii TaxID=2819439 RepID=UPI004037EB81